MLEDIPVGSPKWWLRRLDEERTLRAAEMQAYRDLVDDIHPQVESAETSQKFSRMAGLATTNLTGLAVEATAERMSVEGIRIGDDDQALCRLKEEALLLMLPFFDARENPRGKAFRLIGLRAEKLS